MGLGCRYCFHRGLGYTSWLRQNEGIPPIWLGLVAFKVAGVEGFNSKEESAQPPKNKDLWFACMSLGLLHYILERVFRTTMNPFVFVMHRFAANNFDAASQIATVIVLQLVGLALACVYCTYMLPSQKVFNFLRIP